MKSLHTMASMVSEVGVGTLLQSERTANKIKMKIKCYSFRQLQNWINGKQIYSSVERRMVRQHSSREDRKTGQNGRQETWTFTQHKNWIVSPDYTPISLLSQVNDRCQTFLQTLFCIFIAMFHSAWSGSSRNNSKSVTFVVVVEGLAILNGSKQISVTWHCSLDRWSLTVSDWRGSRLFLSAYHIILLRKTKCLPREMTSAVCARE